MYPGPGASPDPSQLPLAPPFEDPERAGGIVEDFAGGNGPTLLLQGAAKLGDVDRARTAINAGAKLDEQDSWGLAPLHSASIVGSLEAVSLLLDSRASID